MRGAQPGHHGNPHGARQDHAVRAGAAALQAQAQRPDPTAPPRKESDRARPRWRACDVGRRGGHTGETAQDSRGDVRHIRGARLRGTPRRFPRWPPARRTPRSPVSPSTMREARSSNSGSSRKSACASKMPASSAPAWVLAHSYSARVSSRAPRTAASRRCHSASGSSTTRASGGVSAGRSLTSGPMAMPAEAAMPLRPRELGTDTGWRMPVLPGSPQPPSMNAASAASAWRAPGPSARIRN